MEGLNEKHKIPLAKEVLDVRDPLCCFGDSFVCEYFYYKRNNRRKEFWDFAQQDWYHFALFLLTEVFIILLMAFWAIKAGKFANKQEKQVKQYFDQVKYAGIKPGDCDHIWFDFSGDERAKIVKLSDVYYLYVESFNYKTESWDPVNTVSVFRSLAEIKKALFYEFDFFCEENTVLNRHGDEIFRDEP